MNQAILEKLAEEVDKIESSDKSLIATEKETALSVMEELLNNNPVNIPQVGDILDGVVVNVSSGSILLDIGALGMGIVIGKELKDGMNITSKLKKGAVVSATLMELENEDGYMELSIREASYDKAWEDLSSKKDAGEILKTKILDANKGGLMIEINGITGFLPVSQLASEHYPRVEDGDKNKILEILKKLVSQELSVKILDVDRLNEKLIVSEKAATSEKERAIVSQLRVGDIIDGEISGVVDFGAFVKFLPDSKKDSSDEKDKLEGLVHISELAWQLIDNPREIVKTGDKVSAKIIGIDDTRISLSIKALLNDPWNKAKEKYPVGSLVEGRVDKINPFGAFVYLDKDIHGLAHISEFREVFPDKKMEEVIVVGENYKWKIISIEPKDHRMGLIFHKNDTPKKSKAKDEKSETKLSK